MVLFSIIIPTFNRGALIPGLLEHLTNQGFQNFEIVIVDDGSFDNTYQTCREFRREGFCYLYQTNKGVAAARNRGAIAAKGMFLIFLDTDDSVSLDWLNDFHLALKKNPQSDLLICETLIQGEKVNSIIKVPSPSRYDWGHLDLKLFKAGAYAISKSLFMKIGMFDEQIRFGENTELAIRVISRLPGVAFVARPNFIYTPSVTGGSKNLENKIEGNLLVLQKHAAYFKTHANLRKSYMQVTAVALTKIGRHAEARSILWQAWKDFPLSIKIAVRFLLSCFYNIQAPWNK